MPVAVLSHPAGARQVGGPDRAGAVFIIRSVDMENDPCDLSPIGALGLGIQKAEVGDEVLLVIGRQDAAGRGSSGNDRISLG